VCQTMWMKQKLVSCGRKSWKIYFQWWKYWKWLVNSIMWL
jgi:hypothetical protein